MSIARRSLVIWTAIVLDLIAIIAVGTIRGPVDVHLAARFGSGEARVETLSFGAAGEFSYSGGVRRLDLLGGQPMTVALALTTDQCRFLVIVLEGDCDKGLVADRPLEMRWSEGASLRITGTIVESSEAVFLQSVEGGRALFCAETSMGTPLHVAIEQSGGQVQVRAGDLDLYDLEVGPGARPVTITYAGLDLGECGSAAVSTATVIVDGWGTQAVARMEGAEIRISGFVGEVQLGRERRPLDERTQLTVRGFQSLRLQIPLVPDEHPVETLPDPASVSGLLENGINITPAWSESYPAVIPFLGALAPSSWHS